MSGVFVTGATGFAGSNICRKLVRSGFEVSALIRRGSHHPFLEGLPLRRRVEADILDYDSIFKGLSGCETAIHAVMFGKYNRRFRGLLNRTNVDGTRILLEAAVNSGVRRVIILDTISAFCISDRPLINSDPLGTHSRLRWLYPYVDSKLRASEVIDKFRSHCEIVVLHCSPIYGSGDKHNHTGGLIQYLSRTHVTHAPPGGTSVVSVEDVSEACLCVLAKSGLVGSYVLANENLPFFDIYNEILLQLGVEKPITKVIGRQFYFPAFVGSVLMDFMGSRSPFPPYVVRNGFNYRYFRTDSSAYDLNWNPKVTFKNAICEQIGWMREQGLIPSEIGVIRQRN